MKIGLVILLAVSLFGPPSSQAFQPPRLRTISPADFSDILPDALYAAHLRNGKASNTSPIDVLSTITAHIYWEFELRFGESAGWQDLYAFHASMQTLDAYQSSPAILGRSEGPIVANRSIVTAWLAENRPDLSQQAMLTFGNYTISVTPIDLDGDGSNEYLMDVLKTGDLAMRHLWIADGDPTSYTITPLPFPSGRQYISETEPLDFEIGDFNRDGLPEFVIFSAYSFVNFNYAVKDERRYLLGWHDGRISLLTATHDEQVELSPFIPESTAQAPTWTFVNRDTDEALEWVQSESMRDNWSCHWLRQSVYDWTGTFYVAAEPIEIFDTSFNCALRRAEKAMEAFDYDVAIPQYEEVTRRFYNLFQSSDTAIQYAAYAQERLAVAYTMTGRIADALRLLEMLDIEGIATQGTIAAAMLAVTDPTAESLCKAAYDAMKAWTSRDDGGFRAFYRDLPIKARTDDYHFTDLQPFPGEAKTTACDYPSFQPPPIAVPTWTPEPTVTAAPLNFIDVAPVRSLIDEGKFIDAAELTTTLLGNEAANVDELRYLYAMALELAGEFDEAATEYSSLYTADPKSPWSVLAAIHLEPVQTN